MVCVIATLMLRYLEVITAEARRMRLARLSRGHDPRFVWQLGATVRSVGALFLRSYERGERVHLAMLSRGYTGTMPAFTTAPASGVTWSVALLPAIAGVLLAVSAYWVA
jgi:cobalt/nickel transport system permease protein